MGVDPAGRLRDVNCVVGPLGATDALMEASPRPLGLPSHIGLPLERDKNKLAYTLGEGGN